MSIYHSSHLSFLEPFLFSPEMQRLKHVGMNCGCEYTQFPRFAHLPIYSRYEHSLGTAEIVWHFTEDPVQTLAALFHDIATPPFAHSVDFFYGDYLTQETTESDTEQILLNSTTIQHNLTVLGITTDEVKDYHRYPIADNNAPRLSSDRLEYTMGNAWRYGFRNRSELQQYYDDLTVVSAEDGQPELAFRSLSLAAGFGDAALSCSRVYVSDEDRYAMQSLAEVLRLAAERNVICASDFRDTEPEIIEKLETDPVCGMAWKHFCALKQMITDPTLIPEGRGRIIPAKRRYIDPLIAGRGRLSTLDSSFGEALQGFLEESQNTVLYGVIG